MKPPDQGVSPEQQLYARWLEAGTRIAIVALVAAFAAYACGIVEPLIPFDKLPGVWNMPVGQYVAAAGAPTGWGWLLSLGKGEGLNLAGVALLCLVTVACYLCIVPGLVRRGEKLLAALAVCQLLVLVAAISTAFAAGQ